ncbi:hypothetical protein Dimus_008615 [Dionaea muscipula]
MYVPDAKVAGNANLEDLQDWWGKKYGFVSGGFLGTKSKKRKTVGDEPQEKRTCFAEEDQENLYKLVQDKSTSGKQGLGIKDRPRKVAGCRFEGKKTTFSDSDGEDPSNVTSVEQKHGFLSEMKNIDEPKLKLKKLCRQLLLHVPGHTLELKQLKSLIDKHSTIIFSNFSRKEAISFLKQKVMEPRCCT